MVAPEHSEVGARFSRIRRKLDDGGYLESLGLDSLRLVEHLFGDLVKTTESLQKTLLEYSESKKVAEELECGVAPFKEENVRLYRENSQLRVGLAKTFEEAEDKSRNPNLRLRDLEAENNDLKLLVSQFAERIKRSEAESLEKTRRIVKIEENNLEPIVKGNFGSKLTLIQRQIKPTMEIDNFVGDACPQCIRLRNYVEYGKNAERNPKAVDYMKLADSRIEALQLQLRSIKNMEKEHLTLIASLKSRIDTRESEIDRLRDLIKIRPGRDNKANASSFQNDRVNLSAELQSAEMQLKILQRRNVELEDKLKKSILQEHQEYMLGKTIPFYGEGNVARIFLEKELDKYPSHDKMSLLEKLYYLERQLSHCCKEKAVLKRKIDECQLKHNTVESRSIIGASVGGKSQRKPIRGILNTKVDSSNANRMRNVRPAHMKKTESTQPITGISRNRQAITNGVPDGRSECQVIFDNGIGFRSSDQESSEEDEHDSIDNGNSNGHLYGDRRESVNLKHHDHPSSSDRKSFVSKKSASTKNVRKEATPMSANAQKSRSISEVEMNRASESPVSAEYSNSDDDDDDVWNNNYNSNLDECEDNDDVQEKSKKTQENLKKASSASLSRGGIRLTQPQSVLHNKRSRGGKSETVGRRAIFSHSSGKLQPKTSSTSRTNSRSHYTTCKPAKAERLEKTLEDVQEEFEVENMEETDSPEEFPTNNTMNPTAAGVAVSKNLSRHQRQRANISTTQKPDVRRSTNEEKSAKIGLSISLKTKTGKPKARIPVTANSDSISGKGKAVIKTKSDSVEMKNNDDEVVALDIADESATGYYDDDDDYGDDMVYETANNHGDLPQTWEGAVCNENFDSDNISQPNIVSSKGTTAGNKQNIQQGIGSTNVGPVNNYNSRPRRPPQPITVSQGRTGEDNYFPHHQSEKVSKGNTGEDNYFHQPQSEKVSKGNTGEDNYFHQPQSEKASKGNTGEDNYYQPQSETAAASKGRPGQDNYYQPQPETAAASKGRAGGDNYFQHQSESASKVRTGEGNFRQPPSVAASKGRLGQDNFHPPQSETATATQGRTGEGNFRQPQSASQPQGMSKGNVRQRQQQPGTGSQSRTGDGNVRHPQSIGAAKVPLNKGSVQRDAAKQDGNLRSRTALEKNNDFSGSKIQRQHDLSNIQKSKQNDTQDNRSDRAKLVPESNKGISAVKEPSLLSISEFEKEQSDDDHAGITEPKPLGSSTNSNKDKMWDKIKHRVASHEDKPYAIRTNEVRLPSTTVSNLSHAEFSKGHPSETRNPINETTPTGQRLVPRYGSQSQESVTEDIFSPSDHNFQDRRGFVEREFNRGGADDPGASFGESSVSSYSRKADDEGKSNPLYMRRGAPETQPKLLDKRGLDNVRSNVQMTNQPIGQRFSEERRFFVSVGINTENRETGLSWTDSRADSHDRRALVDKISSLQGKLDDVNAESSRHQLKSFEVQGELERMKHMLQMEKQERDLAVSELKRVRELNNESTARLLMNSAMGSDGSFRRGATPMDMEREIANLRNALASLDRDKDEMRMELDMKDERMARLNNDASKYVDEISQLKLRLKNAELQINHTGESAKEQTREVELLKKQLDSNRRDLEKTIRERDDALKDLHKLTGAHAKGAMERRNVETELDLKSKEADDLRRQVQRYIDEVRRIEELLLDKEEEMEMIIQHYRALTVENNTLEAQRTSLEREASSIRDSVRDAVDQSISFKTQLASQNALVQSLEEEIQNLTQQISKLENQATIKSEKEKILESDVKASKDLIYRLEVQMDKLKLDLSDSESKRKQFEAENSELNAHISSLGSRLDDETRRQQQLESLVANSREKDFQSERTTLGISRERDELTGKLTGLQQRSEALNSEVSRYRLKSIELQSELDRTRRQLDNEKRERETAFTELRRLQEQLNSSSANYLLNTALGVTGSSGSPHVGANLTDSSIHQNIISSSSSSTLRQNVLSTDVLQQRGGSREQSPFTRAQDTPPLDLHLHPPVATSTSRQEEQPGPSSTTSLNQIKDKDARQAQEDDEFEEWDSPTK